ncbi:MauE/DoxX family redox-associated membrane protein [Phycicoccus flavus]|uniref:Methylamine utilisation protein MauE domain-containing protein n=1 Tax=Phycicoccus flavus TaxID=2502783 RepID=A0A8T6R906_9MICO|nr:MauE/DoxX family redox-associated membrane protein [Phycicoccus flavus]NHA70336.1 hypothetical protein [Phycicoccus flavus]
MAALLLLCALVLAGTLLVSGVLKLRDLTGTADGLARLDVLPERLVRPAALALPIAEVLLGVLLLATRGSALVFVALSATVLVAAFTVVVVRLVRREDEVPCACFGSASEEPVSALTVARNAGLLVSALLVAVTAPVSGGVLPVLTGSGPAEVLLGVLGATAVASVALLVGRLHAQGRRIVDLEARLETAEARPASREPVLIPDARVIDATGAEWTLAALSAERAQLVIGVAPGCGACHDLAEIVPQWRHGLGGEVDVILVANTPREQALRVYGAHDAHLYADPTGTVFSALGIAGTPAALLLGTNGKVAAGPALGAEAIVELVTAVIQAIGVNVMTGQAHQAQGPRLIGGEDTGDQYLPAAGFVVPDVRVRHEDGSESQMSHALARLTPDHGDVAVVSWRNGCGYCGEIVEQMRFFSGTGDVVLLVNEPVSTVRDQGIEGPVLQVLDADASGVLGLLGTPSGFPVRDLAMQPGGGVGGGSVLRMLRERAVAHGSLTAEQAASPVFGGAPLPSPGHAHGGHDHAGHDHAGHDHAHATPEHVGRH